jgi:DNA-binding NarL/FixJ family response regulator
MQLSEHTSGVVHVVIQHPSRLLRDGLELVISAHPECAVDGTSATHSEAVERASSHRAPVLVVDVDTRRWEARHVLERARQRNPRLRVVGITGADAFDPTDNVRGTGPDEIVRLVDGADAVVRAVLAAARRHRDGTEPRRADPHTRATLLTERELSILELVGAGCTTRQVSVRLDIASKTVENNKRRIFAKLGVQTRAQAVTVALEHGLVSGEAVLALADEHFGIMDAARAAGT